MLELKYELNLNCAKRMDFGAGTVTKIQSGPIFLVQILWFHFN